MTPSTIRDVAKKAGVSVATVSRVLNKSSTVSEGTSQKVLAVIEELDYSPSSIARRLSIGRTHTVGVIIPFLTLPSFVERLRGVESALAESEYDLVLFGADTSAKVDHYFNDLSRRDRADGIIIISLQPNDAQVARFHKSEVPAVLVDARHPDMSSIVVDDVAGGYKATRHLIDIGHRRIGFISDLLENPFNFTSSRDRFQGYQKALESAGIPFTPEYHGQGEHERYEAYRLATEILALPDRPTAIFASSDTHAMGVLEAARDRGLRVPEELSVIGYDDIEIAEYLGLTTIRQLLFESGQRSVNVLLKTLESARTEPTCDVLPTELIVRHSTTSPPT